MKSYSGHAKLYSTVAISIIVLVQFCSPALWAGPSRQMSSQTEGLNDPGLSAGTPKSAGTSRPRDKINGHQRTRSRNFAQVDILLDDQFTIEDLSDLKTAPGSDMEILDDPSRVRAQLSATQVESLYDKGAQIVVLRNFVLVEGYTDEASAPEKDAQTKAACSGTYQSGANYNSYEIPDGDWTYSTIAISGAPGGATVSCMDVHYEISGPWVGFTSVDLTDQGQDNTVVIADFIEGDIYGDITGLSAFNGEPVNQIWVLWATGAYVVDPGAIDLWSIKVYYGGGGGGGYCDASTTSTDYEYISRVRVGDIDNSSGSSGYADYTAYSTQMQLGQSYAITVNNGDPCYPTDVCGIWVDWNQDEDFDDAGETITVSGNPGFGPYTATITPPGTAAEGETRMRVRIVDSDFNALSSCGTASYGEVEDYTIDVVLEPTYCDAYSVYSDYEHISRVVVGTIDNPSGSATYSDFTHLSTTMEIGTPYPITVTDGYTDSSDRCGIWVDWNQDMDFDDTGEQITVSGNSPTFSAAITPPSGAVVGDTRLRIRIQYTGTPQPCGEETYGEVEDYTINVTGGGVTISGYVKNDALVPIEGVLISASTGESTTTNPAGYYELDFPSPWTGTITPTETGWTFEPVHREYSALTTDVSDAHFTATGLLAIEMDMDKVWMYQSLPGQTNSELAATVSVTDDPLTNSSYTCQWEFILPDDVSIPPAITGGGTLSDPCCVFAAPPCDQPAGLSDSGQAFTIKVTVTGDNFGNTGTAEAQFGIALLGDANNDGVVNVADRSIINAFWRTGAAGPYTFTDCDVNGDTAVNVADRSIANAVWRGVLGQNSVSSPCSLR